jgi:von Willebrand factor type A domain
MSATRGRRGQGRAVTRAAAGLLAVGALAGLLLPGTSRAASLSGQREAVGVPPPTSASAVMQALGVDSNPAAELVFMIDTSDSMQAEGLYPKVVAQLTDYFQTLAEQEPQDQVVVITIGQGTANALVYGPGAPPPVISLPTVAHGGTTDFGAAFALALNALSSPPAGIKVGGVVLLSDGGMSAPHDRLYDGGKGYGAPGWAQLRTRAKGLPIPVTGYAVPLTSNAGYIDDQDKALSEVFSPVRTLPGGTSNLQGALAVATQQVVYGEVVSRTSGDSGKGVAIGWSGLPADLDLRSPGHVAVTITLTSRTRKVPLYVTGLHLDVPGQPITVDGSLPAVVVLAPGASATVTANLTWHQKTVGRTLSGGVTEAASRLVLTGTVGSPWTQALGSTFDYTSFTPGHLTGGTAAFHVTEATGSYLSYVKIPLIALAVLLILLVLSTFMTGTLVLKDVDGGSGRALLLPVFPVLWFSTRDKIGVSGRMTVRGAPFHRGMTVRLRLAGRREAKGRIKPGSQTIVGGIAIVHHRLFRRSNRSPYGW